MPLPPVARLERQPGDQLLRNKTNEPSPEDRKRLPGSTNVESLLYALSVRATVPAEVVLVGRASYEIGDSQLMESLRKELGEESRHSHVTNKPILTDDVDVYYTDEMEEIVGMGHKDSYVAKLAECYLHALNEQTLVLPKGWQDRKQPIAVQGNPGTLRFYRLDPMDFLVCKGAAGRPKDHVFLTAFCKAKGITCDEIKAKIDEVLADPPAKLSGDQSAKFHLASLPSRICPPEHEIE